MSETTMTTLRNKPNPVVPVKKKTQSRKYIKYSSLEEMGYERYNKEVGKIGRIAWSLMLDRQAAREYEGHWAFLEKVRNQTEERAS